ncbi:ABC transporter substrate-binding protein [Joostella sp.]|uniref:ABC transporter substrate-binding protein n=1 Tax=Joostella sp. TaxID=2231138 RepID=UPI003A92108C
MKNIIYITLLFCFLSCNTTKREAQEDITNASWEEVLSKANGTTLTMMMWNGDTKINRYMKSYVAPNLKEKYNIDFEIVSGQGSKIVQLLMTEIQASKNRSDVDLVWINGETFFQLREIKALYGPWTAKIPNGEYIDFENPFIGMDFQQPIEGFELPWGNVQMTLIYDSAKVENPPMTRTSLLNFAKEHPGTFTFDNHFTGLTFLKSLLIDIAGGNESLSGAFNEVKYKKYSSELWSYINELKPYLWRKGEVFPEGVAQMHQLFANGELLFTMSNNDAEVDSKTMEGLFPETTRAYVPAFGTIQNSHYLGIPKLSGNKAAALVAANFLSTPEAQLEKMKPSVWGDGTVLDLEKLPKDIKQKFMNIPSREHAPDRSEIQNRAHMELAPEYMIRLAEDFRTEIINK